MSTARLHVTGSAHRARFAEHFDEVLSGLIADCHDPTVAAGELDELVLLTVLAQFAAAGLWAPDAIGGSGGRAEVVHSDQNPRVRLHRYAIVYQPGSIVDVVTFEGYVIQSDQTVVRTAAVRTLR